MTRHWNVPGRPRVPKRVHRSVLHFSIALCYVVRRFSYGVVHPRERRCSTGYGRIYEKPARNRSGSTNWSASINRSQKVVLWRGGKEALMKMHPSATMYGRCVSEWRRIADVSRPS
ncbi:hypothetical protein K439DRAFT_46520 [Ramaria rubella]|nr:hypothetical protein K439DRAFT_46520 [Ramaria rubella]